MEMFPKNGKRKSFGKENNQISFRYGLFYLLE